ncbi:FaeA/PapI family transcriptional regulator [Enterobacteriaceae bacterium LUAb1]
MKGLGKREIRKQESLKKILLTVKEYQQQNKTKLPSTRDIANRCDLSIYNARHMLLQLHTEGIIAPVRDNNKRMLYWETIKHN